MKYKANYIIFLLLVIFLGVYTYNNFCVKTKDIYLYIYEKIQNEESQLYICINNNEKYKYKLKETPISIVKGNLVNKLSIQNLTLYIYNNKKINIEDDEGVHIAKKYYKLDNRNFSSLKINKLITNNVFLLLATDGEKYKFIYPHNDIVNISFYEFSQLSFYRLLISIFFILLVTFLLHIIIKYKFSKNFINIIYNNKIIFFPSFLFIFFIYLILYPGIYAFDIVYPAISNNMFHNFYSCMYMGLAYLFSTLDYSLFVVFHIIIFIYSLLLICSKNFNRKQQLIIISILFLLYISPSFLISIYGIQRIQTSICIFIGFISTYFYWLNNVKENKICSYFIIPLYCILLMLREEYIFFIPMIFFYLYKILNKKSLYKLNKTKFCFCFLISISIILFTYITRNYFSLTDNHVYQSASLIRNAQPYSLKDKNPPKILRYKLFTNEYWNIKRDDYIYALYWFIDKVKSDPEPYLQHAFTRFFHAALGKETWGHPYNKYEQYTSLFYHPGTHAENATLHFLTHVDTYIFGKNVYDILIKYIQFNIPWFKNLILISACYIFIFAPIILYKHTILFFINFLVLLKTLFVIFLSPEPFSLYYYECVWWMFFSIIFLLINNFKKTTGQYDADTKTMG